MKERIIGEILGTIFAVILAYLLFLDISVENLVKLVVFIYLPQRLVELIISKREV